MQGRRSFFKSNRGKEQNKLTQSIIIWSADRQLRPPAMLMNLLRFFQVDRNLHMCYLSPNIKECSLMKIFSFFKSSREKEQNKLTQSIIIWSADRQLRLPAKLMNLLIFQVDQNLHMCYLYTTIRSIG